MTSKAVNAARKYKYVSVRVPIETYEWVKERSERSGVPMVDVVRIAIAFYVNWLESPVNQ